MFEISRKTQTVIEKAAPRRHTGLTREEFRPAMMMAMIERLEGPYNILVTQPEKKLAESAAGIFEEYEEEDEDDFVIRTLDGMLMVIGSTDKIFDDHMLESLTPAEIATRMDEKLKRIVSFGEGNGYIMDAMANSGRPVTLENSHSIPGAHNYRWFSVPSGFKELSNTVLPRIAPDEATCQKLLDWQSHGRLDSMTTPSMASSPAAWDLVLSEQELSPYQARLDPVRSRREDHRDDAATSQPSRIRTMVNNVYTSPYGDFTIMVEVHTREATALGDVCINKIRQPSASDSGRMAVLIPQLTRGGDRYVSLFVTPDPRGSIHHLQMESYHRHGWFRITAPVQRHPQFTHQLLKLLSAQKWKMAHMLGI